MQLQGCTSALQAQLKGCTLIEYRLARPRAVQVDLPVTARLLGLVCRCDVHRGGLHYRYEERGCFRRVGVGGRLGLGRCVNPLGSTAVQPPVLGNFDQPGLLQLAEVVVEAVSGQPGAAG
jgi:hypothetical protein